MSQLPDDIDPRHPIAFSSEVGTGSREENASRQETGAAFRFDRNGALVQNFLPGLPNVLLCFGDGQPMLATMLGG
jgi:hypothetical protein